MKHVFSVDVEEWYQGIELPVKAWQQYESRVTDNMVDLLNLLEEHNVTATCFILGKVAESHPDLICEIHRAGHEIATHGYAHRKVYDLTQAEFRSSLRRSVDLLEDLTGEQVLGYRAPYFTITKESAWALQIVRDEGLLYDSSIYPVYNYRYGIPRADRKPSWIPLRDERAILEVPVSTFPLAGLNVPVGGGAYMRLYPYLLYQYLLRRLEKKGEILGVYVHPWELDPQHPRIDLPWRISLPHYANLGSTRWKLERLFDEFEFVPYRVAFRDQLGT